MVWVMQDVNGNGEPDDEWYELRGSETGKEGTVSGYAVTYYRPAGKGMDVQWTDSEGHSGTIEYKGRISRPGFLLSGLGRRYLYVARYAARIPEYGR